MEDTVEPSYMPGINSLFIICIGIIRHNFDQYPLILPQRWELTKNVQLALIGSRQRAFRRAIDEPCMLLPSPQRVAQNAILLFLPVNFNFYRKKCATEFLCVKKSCGRVVATWFLYVMPIDSWVCISVVPWRTEVYVIRHHTAVLTCIWPPRSAPQNVEFLSNA